MKVTNRHNLPQSIVNAVQNDPYDAGDSDISVTRLISPPYQRKLMGGVELVEDASDRIWSLIGQSVHTILERAYPKRREPSVPVQEFLKDTGYLTEERLFTECQGWKVSGAFDAYENGTLYDFKVTSVWSVIGDTKIEWEQQLNLLRLLSIRNGIPVKQLRIIAILRDWSKTKASIDRDYPQSQVCPVDIPMWSDEQAESYMNERVAAHQSDAPAPCSPSERWQKDDVYAVMKTNRKTAVKLFKNNPDAQQHALSLGKDHFVVLRVGEAIRCAHYCPVSHVCSHYRGEVPF